MKILVAGHPDAGGRIARAAAGLALRGHRVHWHGGGPASLAASGIRPARTRDLPAIGADVVVGEETPLGPAVLGWLAGAHALVLDVTPEAHAGWGTFQRLGWQSLVATALAADEGAPALAAGRHALEHERIGLWPGGPPAAAPDPAHADTEVLERACERALARHRGRSRRAAVFVDRDGTLIRETGYIADPGAVEVLPGVGRALRTLLDAGFPVIVISNQSGIERGYFTAAAAYAVMAAVRERLREQGVELTAVYLCPHRPETGCACRKPRPGLLERAADDQRLALGGSVMIGDRWLDVATGHAVGAAGVLVRTGYGAGEERAGAPERAAEAIVDDLGRAAEWVLDRER